MGASASTPETRRCLGPDDCFEYLEGRASQAEIMAWREHLDVCNSCRILVGEAARSAVISSPSGSELTPRTLVEGEIVANRYRILRFVARGGMGEVYEAVDSVLEQRLALKTLVLTAIDREEAVARFLDEVRIARRVVHHNVCQIWDVGIHRWQAPREGALPFLTMDYLSGETLAQRLARVGRLPTAAALPLFLDLSAGLAAVHAAGIVHRDLKSDNVFLTTDETSSERVVVMDFGLARALERPHARFASSGRRLLGTPAYMAPEQVEGRKVTQAADIYALGIVMFEALTGHVPFSGETAASIALSRLRQDAPKPSTLVPELGPDWDALLGRCLARDPRARFPDVDAVRANLARLSLVAGRRRGAPDRRAVVVASTLMLAFAALLGSGWILSQLAPPPARPPSLTRASAMPAIPLLPATTSATPAPAASTLGRVSLPEPAEVRAPAPRRRGLEPRLAAAKGASPATALIDAAGKLLARGKMVEACETGERAAAQSPAAAEVHAFLGRCYMRLGSPQRARASYARYLELSPLAANAVFVRAMLGDAPP